MEDKPVLKTTYLLEADVIELHGVRVGFEGLYNFLFTSVD